MFEEPHGDEIVWHLLELHRRMHQQFGRVAAEFDLTTAEAGALRRLGQPTSMRAFAKAIGCDASYVTVLIDQLQGLDFVERVPDPRDRRVRQLVLTEQGERTRQALTARVLTTSPALIVLSDERQAALLELLRAIVGDDLTHSPLNKGDRRSWWADSQHRQVVGGFDRNAHTKLRERRDAAHI